MTDPVLQMIDRMRAAQRPELLKLLARTITEMTILGRSYYDEQGCVSHLRQTNEAIHRLAGHLRDLCDPDEAFTESRADGVRNILALLHPSSVSRIHGLKA